jgi:hypothetical protein
VLAYTPALWPIIIALAVGVALGVMWWVFDAAPPGSRRDQFDGRVREWGERERAKGTRRVSFRLWLMWAVAVLLLLVWVAHG